MGSRPIPDFIKVLRHELKERYSDCKFTYLNGIQWNQYPSEKIFTIDELYRIGVRIRCHDIIINIYITPDSHSRSEFIQSSTGAQVNISDPFSFDKLYAELDYCIKDIRQNHEEIKRVWSQGGEVVWSQKEEVVNGED